MSDEALGLPVSVTDVDNTFTDSTFNIVDNVDGTKKLMLQCSNISTATTRTATVPNADMIFPTLYANGAVTGNVLLGGTTYPIDVATAQGNTSVGQAGLAAITTGTQNTALGNQSLRFLTTASNNTAVGRAALSAATTGAGNTAVGQAAGDTLTTGANNILVGSDVDVDTAARTNCIVIGKGTTSNANDNSIKIGFGTAASTRCFLDGIAGITTAVADAVPVLVSASTGQLGTISSSQRYKENIVPMTNQLTDKLYSLNPVTFQWKPEKSADRTIQYGLIAEEVEDVLPELVVYKANAEGEMLPETVKYQDLVPLLLHTVQKLKNENDALNVRLQAVEAAQASA